MPGQEVDVPFAVAVTSTLLLGFSERVAEKLAVECPARTVTLEGIVLNEFGSFVLIETWVSDVGVGVTPTW